MYKQVPTYKDGIWSVTDFETLDDFRKFLLPLFKEPGQYNFDETSLLFNEQSRLFEKNKGYCFAPYLTKDYLSYWEEQSRRCRNGVIFISGSNTWYLTREYYMWINFLKIYDKQKHVYKFPSLWDSQYHTFLYELLAEVHGKHVAQVKKRQYGSSYLHCAKLINHLWFEEGITMKIGASHKDYINEKGSWKFLNEYKSFLNDKTAWYRPMTPDKVLMWQQQIENTKEEGIGKKKSMKGLKGVIQGVTFDKDPANGVGGGIKYFFYEEAGIAPTMGTTVEYLFPAMRSGFGTTGQFIAAGSVGDLDQCEPLKQMILYPEANEIYAIESNLIDDKGTKGLTGLFIPEQWSMPPFIDRYGNSVIHTPTPEQAADIKANWIASGEPLDNYDPTKGSLEMLSSLFAKWKKELTPEKYQLRVSQHPRNIAEAFAWRKESIYPLHLVSAQMKRIEEKEYPFELLELTRDAQGKIDPKLSNKIPITEWPVSPRMEDKEGVIVVWERPVNTAEGYPRWGSYYASVDPVGVGKVTTGKSLNAIYIYKTPIQVRRIKDGVVTTFMEQDKIVAAWCGRFDDLKKTHERMATLIEWYNAWTVVENNITAFIQYMDEKRKLRYLAPKSEMIFLKEAQANQNVWQEYGWKNVGRVFKDNILNYGVDYLTEELDTITKEDGTVVHTTYGIERIPDPMLLKEMQGYQPGINVDRLVAYSAMIAFAKLQIAHIGVKTREEDFDKDKRKDRKNEYIISKGFFRSVGNQIVKTAGNQLKNPFKNLK